MPELISIQSDNFDLIVWSKNIDGSRKRLAKTLLARGKPLPASDVIVSPAISKGSGKAKTEFKCQDGKPIFFENKQYDIEFVFNDKLKDGFSINAPRVEHRLRSVEDSFHYSERTNSLRATINTGNDIGWFRFDLVYQLDGKDKRQSISFEIHPTKMDMTSDMRVMNTAIDEVFPLWRFSLAEKTEQKMQAAKKPHPDFLLLWLAQFEKLFSELTYGLKHIINAPHSRLIPTEKSVRIDRLKGKLSAKLEENIAVAIADKRTDKRFSLNKKILSVDTPENRFIKSVVTTTVSRLTKIKAAAFKSQSEPEKQRLSDSFIGKLDNWQNTIHEYLQQPLFKEVGSFRGLRRESLVLQQKSGYAKVYKVWQQLKWYLELLEGDNNLSLRSVAELYEVWCFLEIRRILLDLEFIEVDRKHIPLINTGVEVSLKDGLQGTLLLKRDDGIKIRLAHEPRFGKTGATIKSWTTTQKPDIYLEATFPNMEKIVWLFDAKYRINNPDDSDNSADYVPDDAINQMHRYRDALIHIEKQKDNDIVRKSRPIFGGYALYPGFYDQSLELNPYDTEIEEIGIGAFSLLPTPDNSGSIWLTNFLKEKLNRKPAEYINSITDKYYVEEAPRIPYLGTGVSRFSDLVIVANQLGPNRDLKYKSNFKAGNAEFYHTKQFAFRRQSIEHHIIQEARYLAVAVDSQNETREIEYIYPILNSTKVKRRDISTEQSGCKNYANPNEIYWLFTLGKALKIKQIVSVYPDTSFKLKLVTLEELSRTTDWGQLNEKYHSLVR
ncbi:DUF2357 domain-containing protein [Thalassotalea sp. PS06]|uniref:DUF2357 domain-containing protein n=1 Tax=Thalassotalea sp. PS06 TaxID=2594005 RepID=UPI001163691D|nr:DUF2357 domain-containing protein [Thalassotalea sp. PS06]QDP02768.1 DUF2357 domain-containing protein [Thalassotalea sp. PS06]